MDSVSEPSINSLSEPAVVHSGQTITAANEQFAAAVEAGGETEIVGQSLTEFLDPAGRDEFTDVCDRIGDTDSESLSVAVGLRTADSDDPGYLAVNTPIEWDDERAVQTRFLSRPSLGDGSSPLSKAVIEQAPSGITILDVSRDDSPILYTNNAFLELTAYDRAAVLGRSLQLLTGDATGDAGRSKLVSAIDADTTTSVELQCHRRDGSVFWNEVTLSPVESEGDRDYCVAYHSDISAQRANAKKRRIFETYAEASDDVMVVTDSNGVIEQVNDAFQEVTGYTPEEAVGNTPRMLKSGEHDTAFYSELWDDVLAGKTWESTIKNRTKQGHLYETTQKIIPVEDDDGEIQHLVGIEREITQKQLRRQILDVLNRILRHNVRNCVTVVDAHAQMLGQNPDEAKVESMATSIQERTSTLHRIAERTETIRKLITSLENDAQPSAIDLSQAETIIDEYRSEYQDATITVEIDGDADAAIRYGFMFEVVVEELIDNAIRHNDQRRPVVEITVSETDERNAALIEVGDNGPGIPTDTWEVIESGEETPLKHTDGVGLWVVYWAVTALGGTVDYTANSPRGSIIRVQVPLTAPEN